MRLRVRSLALLIGLRIWRCRELWCRPAATAPIRPLAWEPPYAAGAAQEMAKKKEADTGVPVVLQWKQIPLVSMRMHVQSLALFSGLRIQCYCELWCRPAATALIRPLG